MFHDRLNRPTAFWAFMLSALVAAGTAAADDWATPLAGKLGVELLEQLDSSGDDVWSPVEHPNVFITTEGSGGGSMLSGGRGKRLLGVAIFDTDSRQSVVSASYDMIDDMDWKQVSEPHGMGVSTDGQWIYLPSTDNRSEGRLLIINARTLKIDKVLGLSGRPHGVAAFLDGAGKSLTYSWGWGQSLFVLDPSDDHRVVGGLDQAGLDMEADLYFVAPGGGEMIATGRPKRQGREKPEESRLIRMDTATWTQLDGIAIEDGLPVWVTFGADGKLAFISGGYTSRLFTYDRQQGRIVSAVAAGVDNPYDIHLGWKEETLWTLGRAAGSRKRERAMSRFDIGSPDIAPQPFPVECMRGDNGTLNPDPQANELWITCDSSFEIIVFDLAEGKVSAHIPMPNRGTNHAGVFLRYDGWRGELLSDMNGLQGPALAAKRRLLGLE